MKLFFIIATMLAGLAHASPSFGIFDSDNNRWYQAQNVNTVRPIASITKLMTAMVTLDYDYDLQRKLVLSRRVPSQLPPGAYTRLDLIRALLVKSDNAAAETLAEDYPGGRSNFIKAMNQAAARYDMTNTRFTDPSGLGVFNISTVMDISRMLDAANGYWLIREISTKKQVAIETARGKQLRTVILNNTNSSLLLSFDTVTVSKTGFTNSAGFCVAMVVEKQKSKYYVIVLGSKNKVERYKTVKDAMYHNTALFDDRQLSSVDIAP